MRSEQTPGQAITVYGAYGHTGRFVVAELRRRGWTPVLAGRDAAKLAAARDAVPPAGAAIPAGAGGVATPTRAPVEDGGPAAPLEVRPASVDDPEALDRALAGSVAVVNCAGPFAETTPPLVAAARRAGIPYLDVTGEALVAIDTFERYADGDRSIVIAPAMAFFGGLGDLLATAAARDWDSADEVTVAVALDSWIPTPGSTKAGERRAGRRVVFRDGGLTVLPGDNAPPTGTWEFPAPFGTQEVVGEVSVTDVVTIPRHLRTPVIHALLNTRPLADLRDPTGTGPEAVDDSGRSAQRFLVDVVVRRGSEERRASAHGQDIYWFTAPIVVEAVERILDGRAKATGVATAGELFDARDFLAALPFDHLSLDGS
ncbi:saccharopine dehydrogenase NADP-binding domain-containing protein [Longispora sp. NPDC051575]|uniref:saccharopine dehydrogenase NADP-binding domain-containing protein n=1 Tax=Longispora sp. NPDC051575 TaxID=3154943 RepID=UPI00341B51E7